MQFSSSYLKCNLNFTRLSDAWHLNNLAIRWVEKYSLYLIIPEKWPAQIHEEVQVS